MSHLVFCDCNVPSKNQSLFFIVGKSFQINEVKLTKKTKNCTSCRTGLCRIFCSFVLPCTNRFKTGNYCIGSSSQYNTNKSAQKRTKMHLSNFTKHNLMGTGWVAEVCLGLDFLEYVTKIPKRFRRKKYSQSSQGAALETKSDGVNFVKKIKKFPYRTILNGKFPLPLHH